MTHPRDCEHKSIVPYETDPDGNMWGQCEECGDTTFPMYTHVAAGGFLFKEPEILVQVRELAERVKVLEEALREARDCFDASPHVGTDELADRIAKALEGTT